MNAKDSRGGDQARSYTTKAPGSLWGWVMLLTVVWWALAALRHGLLQSTGFDLGIYDQVAWQISRGLEARSSLLGLHHLGNHGAWAFYIMALPYSIVPSVQWLFALQAFGLISTAIPLWQLADQAGLGEGLRWLVCWLWWLQPVVFNVNLFDFHPEMLGVPLLAQAVLTARRNNNASWWWCCLLLMGLRDGLTLVVLGLGLWQLSQRQWWRGCGSLLLGCGWLLMLSHWLYPWLNDGAGPAALSRYSALGDSVGAILLNLLRNPLLLGQLIQPREVGFFLVLLLLPLAWCWRRSSLAILLVPLPLLVVNVLSSVPQQRDLLHHYNLPVAVFLVIAAIDGIGGAPGLQQWLQRRRSWALGWLVLCWVLLAKPGYFGSIYLTRLQVLSEYHALLATIPPLASVAAPSHLTPHLTHRLQVEILRSVPDAAAMERWDVALVNQNDPGLMSSVETMAITETHLRQAGWQCEQVAQDGLLRCDKPTQGQKQEQPHH